MPHARKTGTAWDRKKEDYAYTRDLEGTGWAWEFLRRSEIYRSDFRCHGTCERIVTQHNSDTTLYRLSERCVAAESWGLMLLSDPDKTALEQDLFWLPEVTTFTAKCTLGPADDAASGTFSLKCLKGHTAVLLSESTEIVTVRASRLSACINVVSGSILSGNSAVTFFHEGFNTLTRHFETLTILRLLMAETSNANVSSAISESKYLTYLIALDGHLEGRTYREIAEVLLGKDRVGTHWTDETRWMKSRVRRAVERGIALMNGGYRDLL